MLNEMTKGFERELEKDKSSELEILWLRFLAVPNPFFFGQFLPSLILFTVYVSIVPQSF